MNEVLGLGMVAASGGHLALGCGSWSARVAVRLVAEAAMALAMLDACLLGTGLLPARTWSGVLVGLAAVLVLPGPAAGRNRDDGWHAVALVLAAGLLWLPATDGMSGMSGTTHHASPGVLPALLAGGVAAYAVVAVVGALGHTLNRRRCGVAPRRRTAGPARPLLSAVGLSCMTVLMLG